MTIWTPRENSSFYTLNINRLYFALHFSQEVISDLIICGPLDDECLDKWFGEENHYIPLKGKGLEMLKKIMKAMPKRYQISDASENDASAPHGNRV